MGRLGKAFVPLDTISGNVIACAAPGRRSRCGLRSAPALAVAVAIAIAVAVAAISFERSPASAQPLPIVSPVASVSGEADIAVQRAIDEQNRAYVGALLRADAAAYAAIFTDDAVSLPAHGAIVRGRDAIRRAIAATFGRLAFTSGRVRTAETRVAGGVAYEFGTYAFDGEADRTPVRLRGRYATVWKRVDGRWLIALDVSQPDAPPQ